MFHTGNADFSVGTIKCFSHCPTSTLYLCINMSWLEQMQQYMSGFWGRYSKSDEKPDIYRCIYKYICTRYVAARQLGGTDLGRKLKVKNKEDNFQTTEPWIPCIQSLYYYYYYYYILYYSITFLLMFLSTLL